MKKETKTYSISQVSQMTGVSKNRIREWHNKGLLPQVEWIPIGTRNHRRFTQDNGCSEDKGDRNTHTSSKRASVRAC